MVLPTTEEGYVAIAVILLTACFLVVRPNLPTDSNWPLVYYGGLLFYLHGLGYFLLPAIVYSAGVIALIIRFEFLSTPLVKALVLAESLCLAFVLWNVLQHINVL
jgi:hypothetical protein